jgi:long-chain fatty acid transport protein
MSFHKPLLAALLTGSAAISPLAWATNGYFAHGYGIKSLGMAGVSYALPQDALAAASNPAGTALVGNRLDLGVTWFKPQRSVEISGSPLPAANGHYDGNDTESFLIPEFGYTRQLDERLAFGLAVYANGGMNTDYGRNPFAVYGSTGAAGVDLAQVFVTPSLAWRATERHSFGIGLNYAYQRFEARGIDGFAAMSESPDHVTNNGHDHSDGWGLRLGWHGQLTDTLSVGVAWSSKIKTGKFERYEGLFADHGSFDIPENYGIGLAWQATDHPGRRCAADRLQRREGHLQPGQRAVQRPPARLRGRPELRLGGHPCLQARRQLRGQLAADPARRLQLGRSGTGQGRDLLQHPGSWCGARAPDPRRHLGARGEP